MDGIFVAYHNTLQFYGFEYLPLEEMENVLFENPSMKDYSFEVSLFFFQNCFFFNFSFFYCCCETLFQQIFIFIFLGVYLNLRKINKHDR